MSMTTKVKDQPPKTTAEMVDIRFSDHAMRLLHEHILAATLLGADGKDGKLDREDIYLVTTSVSVQVYAKRWDHAEMPPADPEKGTP